MLYLRHPSVIEGLTILGAGILLFVIYNVLLAIYNVTLHPLASVPGPKLAGATKLYQTYWCYSPQGSIYYRKVREMHRKYGPIVRVRPSEVSLSEAEDFDRIYHVRTRFTKDLEFYKAIGVYHGMFGTKNNDRHRQLRAPWSSYFSHAAVQSLEGLVQSKVDLLCQQVEVELNDTGAVPMHALFQALMIDIISEYTLPKCLGLLERRPYGDSYASNMSQGAVGIWAKMPNEVVGWLLGQLAACLCQFGNRQDEFYNLFKNCTTFISKVVADDKDETDTRNLDRSTTPITEDVANRVAAGHMDVYGNMATKKIFIDEAYSFNVAAAFNAPGAFSVTLYHIVSSPLIYARLRTEILEEFQGNSSPSYSSLRKLPYLTACINEGLRLAYGAIGRLPRVVPEPGQTFQGHDLPAGTVVGVWAYVLHHNPSIWGNDHEMFNPDRWLRDGNSQYLNRYLNTFGKDNRQCLARDLSLSTMYIVMAALLRKYSDLKVHGGYSANGFCDHFAAVVPFDKPKFAVRRAGLEKNTH